jgi:hypothetical protein
MTQDKKGLWTPCGNSFTQPDDFLSKCKPADVPYELAYNAHRGTSFVPDTRAKQRQQEYLDHMREVHDELVKLADTPEKRILLGKELDRYREGWLEKFKDCLHADSRVASSMITGSSNFPAARMKKHSNTAHKRTTELLEFQKRAFATMERKLAPERGPIMSADADAVEKLQAKLAKLEETQVLYKKINATHKRFLKDPASLDKSDLPENAKELIRTYKPRYSWEPHPIAPYQLQNNNAEIRRTRSRIAEVTKMKASPYTETLHSDGIRVVENPEAGRIQVFFPRKPDRDTITIMKGSGFHWSRSQGAWQRHLNDAGRIAVESLMKHLGNEKVAALEPTGKEPATRPERELTEHGQADFRVQELADNKWRFTPLTTAAKELIAERPTKEFQDYAGREDFAVEVDGCMAAVTLRDKLEHRGLRIEYHCQMEQRTSPPDAAPSWESQEATNRAFFEAKALFEQEEKKRELERIDFSVRIYGSIWEFTAQSEQAEHLSRELGLESWQRIHEGCFALDHRPARELIAQLERDGYRVKAATPSQGHQNGPAHSPGADSQHMQMPRAINNGENMGWYFTKGATKADIIAKVTEEQPRQPGFQWSNADQKSVPSGYDFSSKTLQKCVRGSVLWTVEETVRYKEPVEREMIIGCYLLKAGSGEAGYKPMDEAMGPYYYSCPLAYLDMVPETNREWREKVRAYHAEKEHKQGPQELAPEPRKELPQETPTHAPQVHETPSPESITTSHLQPISPNNDEPERLTDEQVQNRISEKPRMKLPEAMKLAVEKHDAVMLAKVVGQLWHQFGCNYEQCLQIVQKHTGISAEDYEDMLYELDTMESQLYEAQLAAKAAEDRKQAMNDNSGAPSVNPAPPDQDHQEEEKTPVSLRPTDKAGIVAAATLAAVTIGKPVYENRRDAWQKVTKEWHAEEQEAKDAPATQVASPVESEGRTEIPEALSESNNAGTEDAPTMTELEKNQPILELKCGRVLGSIWDHEGPNGDIRYSLTLTRSWKDSEGNLHQLTHLDPEDLLYVKEILAKAEQIFKEELGENVTTKVKVSSPRYEERKHGQKQSM